MLERVTSEKVKLVILLVKTLIGLQKFHEAV